MSCNQMNQPFNFGSLTLYIIIYIIIMSSGFRIELCINPNVHITTYIIYQLGMNITLCIFYVYLYAEVLHLFHIRLVTFYVFFRLD
jgi:hypothetical protein